MSVTFTPRGVEQVEGEYGPEPAIWANFANANARRVIAVAGLGAYDEDLYGACAPAALPAVAQRLVRALNTRDVYTREATVSQRPGCCTVIDCGTTEEAERSRYASLLAVVRACIERGVELHWG